MNLYDFNDLSDLPADLGKRLSTSAVANPNVATYSGIVEAAAVAGLKLLNISQVEAIAVRMGLTVKSQQTIRTALNSGVKAGLLVKPSRQTYAAAEAGTEVVSEAAPVDAMEVEATIDPVATTADGQIDPLA